MQQVHILTITDLTNFSSVEHQSAHTTRDSALLYAEKMIGKLICQIAEARHSDFNVEVQPFDVHSDLSVVAKD